MSAADPGQRPKRSLFKKPTWERPQAHIPVDDESFFSRANHSYVAIAAEDEARRQKKAKKKPASAFRDASTDGHDLKRRRVSLEDSGDEDKAAENSITQRGERAEEKKTPPSSLPDDESRFFAVARSFAPSSPSPPLPQAEPSLDSTYYNVQQTAKKPLTDIIALDDDGEELDFDVNIGKSANVSDTRGAESDEEFPELALKAREQARQRLLEAETLSPVRALRSRSNGSPMPSKEQAIQSSHSTSPPADDEPVHILITSDIPGSKPLIVLRQLDQRLKDVRLGWCKHQGYSNEQTDDILLTWKGMRIYDISSCSTLGIGGDDEEAKLFEGLGDSKTGSNRRIHMVAVTEDMFEEAQQRQKDDKKKRGSGDKVAEADDLEMLPSGKTKAKERVHIVLRAKGLEDFRLTVKPTTTVSRIHDAFKTVNEVPDNEQVSLLFDGEPLDLRLCIKDTEISDLDTIDVSIKRAAAHFAVHPIKEYAGMKILTANFVTCAVKTCKSSPLSFPLHFQDAELEQVDMEYNQTFLKNILPRIDWDALKITATELGFSSLPSEKPEIAPNPPRSPAQDASGDIEDPADSETAGKGVQDADDSLWRDLHKLLLETSVMEGKLICGSCGHEYKIKEGIANFLLPSHLV